MTQQLARIALVVSNSGELSLIVKATIVLAVTLAGAWAARRARASVRHVLLASAFGVLAALPAVAMLMPPVSVAVPDPAVAGHREIHLKAVGGNDLLYLSKIVEELPAPPIPGPSAAVSTLLRVAWGSGAILFLAPVAAALWRLRVLRRRGVPWLDAMPVARMIARHAGIGRPIEVLLSEKIATPMTCGFVRPAIVMPADARSWSGTDVRRAMVHELEHVRRADWPVQLAARVVCALYWFHPLAWIAWRHLCLESERACDDAVLRGAESTDYAEQLVTLAARVSHHQFQPALSMANRSDLSARVRALLDSRQARGRAGVVRAASVAGLVALLALTISPLRAVGRSQTAQAPAASAGFEVASIKPNNSGDGRVQLMNAPGRFNATNVTLRMLIRQAYQLQDSQIVGGPNWLTDDHYDIVAKLEGTPQDMFVAQQRGGGPTTLQLAIRALLAERFNLVAHNESREMPIYALVLARADGKLGPEMKKSETDCAAMAAARGRGPGGPPPPGPPAPGQAMPCGIRIGMGNLVMGGASLAQFANSLGMFAGRLVFDKTGLTGGWDLNLTWTPDNMPQRPPGAPEPPGGAIDPNGPSLFTAIQEQLGLKLDSQRGPVDVLVIDKADHPTPN